MYGARDVVREEVDDLVVPIQYFEYGLLPLTDLEAKVGLYMSCQGTFLSCLWPYNFVHFCPKD